jgi:hypothetical protein
MEYVYKSILLWPVNGKIKMIVYITFLEYRYIERSLVSNTVGYDEDATFWMIEGLLYDRTED